MNKLCFLLFLCFSIAGAQNCTIQSIQFEGNEKCKEKYLRRFISSEVGDVLDPNRIKMDAQYLTNIPSIYDCKVKLDTFDQACNVRYIIRESQTLIPFTNFGISNQQSGNWFLLGLTEYNFLGKGITIEGSYQYNRKNTYQLLTSIPYIGIGELGMEVNFKKWASIEPLYFQQIDKPIYYDYKNNSVELAFLYHLNVKNTFRFSYAFFQETYERNTDEYPDLPNEAVELKNSFSIQYKLEKVNYFYHLLDGWRFFSNSTVVMSNGNTLGNYFQTDFNLSYFKRVRDNGNLAFSFTMGWANNADSPFTSFVLDSQTNLRGIGDRVARGASIASFNAEYRFDLYTNNWLAIQGVGFNDVASIQPLGESYSQSMALDHYQSYTGGGIRIILKKVHSAIFRIDYGIKSDMLSDQGLVIGFGQFF